MAFRFRRSVKIAPGLRVNFGKNGASISAGVRGASVTFGARGTYANVGIPGTGISFRSRIDNGPEIRRATRAQQRLEKEYLRQEQALERQRALADVSLTLDKTTGRLHIHDAHGAPLEQRDLKLLWEQKDSTIFCWLADQAIEINGDIDLITMIHHDTPSPDSEPVYEPDPFAEPAPTRPARPAETARPVMSEVPPLGFIAKLIPGRRSRHLAMLEDARRAHEHEIQQWEVCRKTELDRYQADLELFVTQEGSWKQRQDIHNSKEIEKQAEFPKLLRTDPGTMDAALEEVLSSLSWPRETIVSYQITDHGKIVWLDVDLPEIEDIPQRTATVSSTGRKLNIRTKSAKQLQLEYAQHIHAIVFRLVGIVFATLPVAKRAVVSGFSQRLNNATGVVSDEYLLSVDAEREEFSKIDFASLPNVDPAKALEMFSMRRKLSTTGIFKAIAPYTPGDSISNSPHKPQ